MFSSQRVSQTFQMIEAFEAVPSGGNCIRFEWQRRSRVLQAQCRKQWQRVKKPFSDSVARVYRLGKRSLTNGSLCADEDCRRLDGAVGVASPSLTDYQKSRAQNLRQCISVGSVLEVEGASHGWPGGRRWVATECGSHCRCGAVTRPQSPCSYLMALSLEICWN